MKGKKLDHEFIGQYISNCIEKNITSSDDMVLCAKNRVKEIDEKIMEVEILKQERSKLLDVIHSFQRLDKSSNYKEIKLLSLYKIGNTNLCKLICENLNKIEIKEMNGYNKMDILSCLKQLLEHRVIIKSGSKFAKGELFEEYCSFVLKMDIT